MRSAVVHLVVSSALAALALASFGAGCGGSEAKEEAGAEAGVPVTPQAKPDGGALPCAVDRILAANCRRCHTDPPQFGAPVPLVSHADLAAPSDRDPARKVYELIPELIASDARPMPPPPNARLSDADRATLAAWVGAGAPARTEDCQPAAVKPDTSGITCTPDLPIGPAIPFTMPQDSGDEYVCYGVELARPVPTHVTAFAPRIDKPKIVHHVVLFEADAAYSTTPTRCGAGGSLRWRMVMGWAPGGKGLELPPEAGFPLATAGKGATHYVVQMHYSNPQGLAGQVDTSGFDLCTAPPRPFEADVLAFGTQAIDMPPNEPSYERTCSITVPQEIAGRHLIASMPHMHKLGTAMSTTLIPGGGPAVDLGTINAWSFDTQAWLGIAGGPGEIGAVANAGDVIQTRCAWKNTTGQRVTFGENTANEMCYSFTVYYPKIVAPVWSWAAPAMTSQCN